MKIDTRILKATITAFLPFALSSWPKTALIAAVALESFCRSRMILPMDASKKSGSESRRRVWPVGAVSKIIRLNFSYSGAWMNCTTFEIATASSRPAKKDTELRFDSEETYGCSKTRRLIGLY